ncbi:MAG: ABC transporter permease [Microcella sp.]|nr:ABC transporter permease [Microcella sp.]
MPVVSTRAPRGAVGSRPPRRWAPVALLGPGSVYLALFFLVPLGLIVSYAFLTRGRFGGVVPEFTLDNFARLVEPVYLQVIATSLGTAAITTLLALVLGFPTAYVISRLPRRWRTTALILVLLPFWTNFLIRTYAWIILLNDAGWINGALVAGGIVDEPIRMLYTQPAVVVGLLYIYLPLMILPLYSAIERIDPALEEAATNLGASRFRVFRTITIPLALPGMLIGCVFVFVPSMANFVIPELIGGGKSLLLGNLIRDQFLKARDWPFGAALALVLTAILVLLLVLQARAAARTEGGGGRAHT